MLSPLRVQGFYDVFREIIALVHSSTDVREVLELVVSKVTQMLGAKGTMFRSLDPEKGQLELCAAYGLSDNYVSKGPVSNMRVIEEMYRENRPIIIDDIQNDPRVQYPEEAWKEGIRMMLNLPITLRKNIIGVIRIFFTEKKSFSDEDLDFLSTVAQECACAVERAWLFEELQCRYDRLVTQTDKLTALGRMAAGIAHEINNPLSGILLFSTSLREKADPGGPVGEGLDVIIEETVRCREIIKDLLEFSREKTQQKTVADLNTIILKALTLLDNTFRATRITIVKDLSSDMPETLLNQNQIQQVFINLLLNSAEAIGQDGTITVGSRYDLDRKCVVGEVQDTGGGISEEDLERIFEPFYTTKPKGTGLGLAVSYGIVKNHQGTLKAFNNQGGGAHFVVEIPAVIGAPTAHEHQED